MNENEPQEVASPNPESPTPPVPAAATPKVEGYEILGPLGEGETGVVWRALQVENNREVALKLLSAEVFGTSEARKRFERDATIAAQLQHPNIARLYEVTLADDVYCYAAELIDGLPLDEYARVGQFTAPEALWLVWMVCEAVQHAHQHGLIHGNLKPANILVTDDGEPHVLDFALDRAYWDSDAAAQAAADEKVDAGLPVFLAPEALSGARDDLDSRADVYSLGALLLWLLTGQSSYDETTREPRTVDSADDELQAMLRKALAADREVRYATPGEFAADISHYLQDEPLTIIPATPGYVLRKAYRRHRALIALGAAALVLVATLFIFTGLRNRLQRDRAVTKVAQVEAERQRVQEALERTRTELAVERAARVEPVKPAEPTPEQIAVAAAQASAQAAAAQYDKARAEVLTFLAEGNNDQAEAALWEIPQSSRQWEWGRLLALCNRDLYTFRHENDRTHSLAVAPDGRWFVTGGNTTARLWGADGREMLSLRGATAPIVALSVSTDGRYVVGGCADDTVRLWDAATGRVVVTAKGIAVPQAVAFTPDGSLVVAGGEELTLRLLDPRTGAETARAVLGDKATCVTFSPDRSRLVSGHVDGRVVVWETANARRLWEFRAHTGATTAVAFAPDGRTVVSAGLNLTIRFWQIEDGREAATWRGRGAPIEAIAFTRDGQRLLTGSRDRTATLWDVVTGTEIHTLRGHAGPLTAAAFLPDGRRVLTASLDGTARLWRADKPGDVLPSKDEATAARTFASLTTTKDEPPTAVQRAEDGSWHVIEVATGKELSKLESPGNLTTAIVTSDGQRVIGAGDKGEPARIWDAQTGRLLMGLSDVCVRAIGRSAVPRRIIVRDCDRNVRIWDAADWNLTREEYQAQRRAALAGRNP